MSAFIQSWQRGHKAPKQASSAYDPRYQAMNLSNIGSGMLGEGGALGTQALPELGGGLAMGDPMQSSIARRRQRLSGMQMGQGTGMLPAKSPGGL